VEISAPADNRAQRQRSQQLLEAARSRYSTLSNQEKGALVDELVELKRYHRKSVLRVLRQQLTDHRGVHRLVLTLDTILLNLVGATATAMPQLKWPRTIGGAMGYSYGGGCNTCPSRRKE
jgi:hypothetical protein